jgi:hypothetical protein
MMWSFVRESARVDIEVRRAAFSGRYELVVDYPDGSEIVERFRRPRRLVDRSLAVQRRLIEDGWQPVRRRPGSAPSAPPTRRRGRMLRRIVAAFGAAQSRWARRLAACFGF